MEASELSDALLELELELAVEAELALEVELVDVAAACSEPSLSWW